MPNTTDAGSAPTVLCRLDEIADGTARGFDPLGQGVDLLFAVRRGDRVHGWRNACPHIDGAPMAWRRDAYLNAAGDRIVCSAHGAQFDIASGRCLLGACIGRSLQAMPVRIEPQGRDGAPCLVIDLAPDLLAEAGLRHHPGRSTQAAASDRPFADTPPHQGDT